MSQFHYTPRGAESNVGALTDRVPLSEVEFSQNTRFVEQVVGLPSAIMRAGSNLAEGTGSLLDAAYGVTYGPRASWLAGRFTDFGDPDPTFNPFQFGRDMNLTEDPIFLELVRRGTFDNVRNDREFFYHLENGRKYLDDLEGLSRAGTVGAIGAQLAVGIIDPINLIPVGGAAASVYKSMRAFQNMQRVRGIAIGATAGGAGSLMALEIDKASAPYVNEPGMADEIAAFTFGAALGGAIGALMPAGQVLSTGHRIKPGEVDAIKADVIRDTQFAMGAQDGAMGAMAAPNRMSRSPIDTEVADVLQREFDYTSAVLQRLLDEPATEGRQVTLTMVEGDANWNALQKVRQKYKEAGVYLHETTSEFNRLYGLSIRAKEFAESLDSMAIALPGTIAEGPASQGIGAASTAVLDSPVFSFLTPRGRILAMKIGQVQEAFQVVAGDAVVTRGAAEQPFSYQTPKSAIALKSLDEAAVKTLNNTDRAIYQQRARAAREKPIEYGDSQIVNEKQFVDAEFDYAVAKRERSELPSKIDPAISQSAELHMAYYRQHVRDLEDTGMFTITRHTLQDAEGSVQRAEADYLRTSNRLDNLNERLTALQDDVAVDPVGTLPRVKKLNSRIEKAEATLAKREERLAKLTARQNQIARVLERRNNHVPVVYNVGLVRAQSVKFRNQLSDAIDRQHRMVDGVEQSYDDAPIFLEAWEKVTQNDPRFAGLDVPDRARNITDVELRGRYEEQRRAEILNISESVYNKLTDPTAGHGIVRDGGPTPGFLKSATLDIDRIALTDFMIRDLRVISQRYHNTVIGELAIRKAIRSSPTLKDAKLANGEPVRSSTDLKDYINEGFNALREVANENDQARGVKPDTRASEARRVERMQKEFEKSFGIPLEEIAGRQSSPTNPIFDAFRFLGRNLMKLSFMNKMGGGGIAALAEFAPIVFASITNPRLWRAMPSIISGLGKNNFARRELEVINLFNDFSAKFRLDPDLPYAQTDGVGSGVTRRVTGAVDRAADAGTRAVGTLGMLGPMTNMQRRMAGFITIDWINRTAPKMERLADLSGDNWANVTPQMLRKAGIKRWEVQKMSAMGLNPRGARQWNRMSYQFGENDAGSPIRESMSFEDFLKSKKRHYNRIDQWSDTNRDLVETVGGAINRDIDGNLVIKADVFDRPLINRSQFGAMFNQFNTWLIAFGNKRLRAMSQTPAPHLMPQIGSYILLGALSDAIGNHLSGRRTFDETAQLWAENPQGMLHQALNRSGMYGWLSRPFAITDAMGFGPGALLNNTVSSTQAASGLRNGQILMMGSPVAVDIDRTARTLGDIFSGQANESTRYNAMKMMPFQNLLWARLAYDQTGAPVIPEAFLPDQTIRARERMEPMP